MDIRDLKHQAVTSSVSNKKWQTMKGKEEHGQSNIQDGGPEGHKGY